MPRLDGASSIDNYSSYGSTLASLFSLRPPRPRKEIARAVLLRSVRLGISPNSSNSSSRVNVEDRLDGFHKGTIPLRVRPAFLLLNVGCLCLLAVLGFHPNGQKYVPFNDKVLHFFCFLIATALFYFIWDVDEPARRVWIWRHFALLLTWVTCFAAGGLGSELVQSLLPYKEFQWGDVVANFLGSGVGLFISYHAERRYRTRREIARLYEPLDQELYGDDMDEDEDEERTRDDFTREGPGSREAADVWKSALHSDEIGNGDGKKVRFEEHEQRSQTGAADLFRIDDEEDEANAWRGAGKTS